MIKHTTAKLAVSKLKRLKVDWVDKRIDIVISYIIQQETLQAEYEALKKELAKSVGYCSKLQNELNTLKNDVARFIKLSKNPRNKKTNDIRPFDEWASEVIKLEIELFEKCNTKVGKEE